MPSTQALSAALSTGTGRQALSEVSVSLPDPGTGRIVGFVSALQETFARASFTDGGAAAGTIQFTGSIPAGSVILGTKVTVGAGFIGDTSAALIIGDGSDTDRYNTSTIDVFTTAATGVQSGVPSGTKLVTTANRPTLTVTSATDFTNVSAGEVTVAIYFIQA